MTVDGGRWTVDGGRWTVDGGRWTVDGGRWTRPGIAGRNILASWRDSLTVDRWPLSRRWIARATLHVASGKPPCQRSTVNGQRSTKCPLCSAVVTSRCRASSTVQSERNLGRDTAAIAGDAHHLPLTPTAISVTGHFSFITAVLASFRLVREASLSIEGLFVLAEHELPSAIGTIEGFVVESVHEPLIS